VENTNHTVSSASARDVRRPRASGTARRVFRRTRDAKRGGPNAFVRCISDDQRFPGIYAEQCVSQSQ